MPQVLDQFIDYFRYALEILGMVFLFSYPLPHHEKFVRYSVYSFAYAFIQAIVLAVTSVYILDVYDIDTYWLVSLAIYTFGTMPGLLLAIFAYRTDVGTKASIIMSTMIVRNAARGIYQLIYAGIAIASDNKDLLLFGNMPKIYLLIYYVVLFVLVYVFYFFMNKTVKNPLFRGLDKKIFVLLATSMIFSLFFGVIENTTKKSDIFAYVMTLGCLSLVMVFIVFVQFLLFDIHYKETETRLMEQNFQSKLDEYRLIKESVETINLKCHDLRHQIRAAALSGKLDEQYVKDVTKSIDIYDRSVDTGNEDLDLMLMDLKFRSDAAGINVSLIVDGNAISFMERQDIISMFGNILENALSYEKSLEKDDRRFIAFNLYKKNGFLFCQCENYIGKVVVFEQKDGRFHGFGTKSIEAIARKYDGSYRVDTDAGIYKVIVTIPLPQEQIA